MKLNDLFHHLKYKSALLIRDLLFIEIVKSVFNKDFSQSCFVTLNSFGATINDKLYLYVDVILYNNPGLLLFL